MSSAPSTLPWSETAALLARLAGIDPAQHVTAPGPDAASSLRALAACLGFRCHALSGSFFTLRRALENGAILVRLPEEARAEPLLVLSDVDRRDRVRVHQVTVDEPGSWLSEAELLALLGTPSWSLNSWLLLRSARPLQALRSPDPKAPRGALSRLVALAGLEREDLFVVTVFAAVVGLLSLATPVAVQALVNTIAFGTLTQPIVVVALILLAVLSFAGVLTVVETYVLEMLERRWFLRAAEDVSERLPLGLLSARGGPTPELMNRFFDVFALQKAANLLLLDGLDLVLKVGVGLLLLAIYHPLLLAFDVVILASLAFILWLGRRGPAAARQKSKAKYRFVAWLENVSAASETFRLPLGRRLAGLESEARALQYLTARASFFQVVLVQKVGLVALQAVAGAGLLGLGGFLVIQGRLTLGELVAAELVLATMVSAFVKLGKQLSVFFEALASMDKVGQLLDFPSEPARPEARFEEGGTCVALTVAELELAEGGCGLPLRVEALRVAPGEFLSIDDRDGGQSEVLFDVIAGRVEVAGGRVELDGQDVRDLDAGQVAGMVMVLRGPETFDGTVLEHLCLRNESQDLKEVTRLLERLGIWERVQHLPERLDSRLSLWGGPLSEPERVLLTVARAALVRPRLLLVDGLLDRLPLRHRGVALSVLREAGMTLLVRTHLPDLSAAASQVAVIEGGVLRWEEA